MQVEIVVPQMGESISEATVASWLVAKGDAVAEGDVLVELETDKVMVEVPAAEGGVVLEIRKPEGDSVTVGDILGLIDTEASGNGAGAKAAPEAAPKAAPEAAPKAAPEAAPKAAPKGEPEAAPKTESEAPAPAAAQAAPAAATSAAVGPAARRLAEEHGVDLAQVSGTGPRGQVTKDDVQRQVDGKGSAAPRAEPAAAPAPAGSAARAPAPAAPRSTQAPGEREERVKMTRLRLRIAERLLEAQQSAAILTTFNEVDMGAAMALRAKYKEAFQKKYGVAIGFMSVFTKACIEALKAFPAVNAEIQGDEIVYKRFYDIGVAVGTERGLVVPIVRDADVKSFIEIELEIAALAGKARENKLSMDDLTGGTFTISNGGIYGSMLSTPILNPPQVGILGMHNIVKRPVVVNDQIEVRPMMYLALSYDHRIIDGREAVQFLIRVRECVEDPARILLEI